MIKTERIFDLTPNKGYGKKIVYWMSREQRVKDNYPLLFARSLAKKSGQALEVIFTPDTRIYGDSYRHFDFMFRGIEDLATSLKEKYIPFTVLSNELPESLSAYLNETGNPTLVVDFDPVRIHKSWFQKILSETSSKIIEIDGHNIVPARFVSQKQEFGAYTLRPKIRKNLEFFLEEFPELESMDSGNYFESAVSIKEVQDRLNIDRSVGAIGNAKSGETEARKAMKNFIELKLQYYSDERNNPNKHATSDLSPYLHFGQISAQRIAIEILKNTFSGSGKEAFLEELIVRKELADNFCLYNVNYDNAGGFHDWALKTHELHARDEREYLYTKEQFEHARTHEELWNAAQLQLTNTGRMHGYMRMYWAKKILEWTGSADEAMEVAIYLNDKYALDGRDPNGYAGIAWSVGGVHDRAWGERPVFGKIRYMNYNGCKRKFDVKEYIKNHTVKR